MSGLALAPVTLREANAFVERHHRHHAPVRGCRACVGAAMDERFVGVAILGRPVSRVVQSRGDTVEITRLCTDGTRNAASFLYGAARRLAFALGYRRVITYTLPEEGGPSLRGAGYRLIGERGGGTWSRPSRPRVDSHPTQAKLLWEAGT